MVPIGETKAEEIAEDHIRKMMTFRMEPVEDTSRLSCYGIDDFSDYHVFWFSNQGHILKADSYVAVHKKRWFSNQLREWGIKREKNNID